MPLHTAAGETEVDCGGGGAGDVGDTAGPTVGTVGFTAACAVVVGLVGGVTTDGCTGELELTGGTTAGATVEVP